MASRFLYRRRVTFAETDLAGIMHFSNFLRWMEEAEHAFHRSLGLSVHPVQQGFPDTETGWPRVKVAAEYFRPLQFEEEAEVELLVAEVRTKSVRYAFRIWKSPDDAVARVLAAAGELVVVAVRAVPGTREMKAVPIPEAFRERIEAVPGEALELSGARAK
jgi:acyl-CoA thioester hydrolase